ncbi:MAG: hypothetical protein JWR12_1046 [Mucilaginibacter sp.]|nr:hypothetical protein [Mucilaginibacter sp.]
METITVPADIIIPKDGGSRNALDAKVSILLSLL